MTRVRLHIEALRELREAREWYAQQGVAEQRSRLLHAVDARVQELGEHPESFPRDSKRSWARKARLLDWPYTLIFALHDSTVTVLAIAHGKRQPSYWAKRRPKP